MSNVKAVITFWDEDWNAKLSKIIRETLIQINGNINLKIIDCRGRTIPDIYRIVADNYRTYNLIISTDRNLPLLDHVHIRDRDDFKSIVRSVLFDCHMHVGSLCSMIFYDIFLLHIITGDGHVVNALDTIYDRHADINTEYIVGNYKPTKIFVYNCPIQTETNSEATEVNPIIIGGCTSEDNPVVSVTSEMLERAEIKNWCGIDIYRLYFTCHIYKDGERTLFQREKKRDYRESQI